MAKSNGSPESPDIDALARMIREKRTSPQEIRIAHIDRDPKFQCRVETSMKHVSDLQLMMNGKQGLDRIVLFYDVKAKRYILADGFHRCRAHEKEGLKSILAYVIVSDKAEEEAILFAASINLKRSMLPPTQDDRKKALESLLEHEIYREYSAAMLARECGVSITTAKKWKIDFCGRRGISLPLVIVTSAGTRQSATPKVGGQIKTSPSTATKGGSLRWIHRSDGIPSETTSDSQPSTKMREAVFKQKGVRLVGWPDADYKMLPFLATRGFSSWVVLGTEKIGMAFRLRDIAFASLRQSDSQSLRAAALLLLWQSLASLGIARMRVVVTVPFTGFDGPALGAFQSLGVQFVTPEEFFAELAADDADGTATVTPKPTPSPRPTTGATSHATL